MLITEHTVLTKSQPKQKFGFVLSMATWKQSGFPFHFTYLQTDDSKKLVVYSL